jgi:hypothetical protein
VLLPAKERGGKKKERERERAQAAKINYSTYPIYNIWPTNIVARQLALLLCSRYVSGSNSGPETSYPD